MSTQMKYTPGSLVTVREREWIVLPGSTDQLIQIRPIDGTEDEVTKVLTELEDVQPASFALPSTDQIGDYRSCRFLRDALRLNVRNSAGPFRSFGRIAVDPRPYQLVPLMLALKQDVVRILIADDVGIGKTIEASLIVRELLDRGDCQRFCVLCPPYLAEQWERELYEKFHIDAKLVLSNTVNRLEKQCAPGESIFEVYPYTIVSIDFIKSDRRRQEFLRTAPELIIIDEAHSVGYDAGGMSASRHQRHMLAEDLCKDANRNIILVTATPHSGNENAFRSLLTLLNPEFRELPEDLTGKKNEKYRREIAKYLIQRRRADIRYYLDEKTVFPECEAKDEPWLLTAPYEALFDRALKFAKEMVEDDSDGHRHQRVRWWSALSLLRALASSPAAAKSTLQNRSQILDEESPEEIEQMGRKLVMDIDVDDETSLSDIPLGSDCYADAPETGTSSDAQRQKLRDMAKAAELLYGDNDAKMLKLVSQLKSLVKDGFQPIVFCRFIPTVDYLCEQLRKRLPKGFEITGVSGLLPPEERERRILELAKAEKRILICTDCLSEGINLQDSFNAVIHYDLSWNPTRHEQREGRVDRFGQASKKIRTITFYGKDNQIDGVVLNILLQKHRQIKSSLGISVPVPANTREVIDAIFSGLLMKDERKNKSGGQTPRFREIDEYYDELHDEQLREKAKQLFDEWDNITEREKRSQTMFAQDSFSNRVGEIKNELVAMRESIGAAQDVRHFAINVLKDSGASVSCHGEGEKESWTVNLTGIPDTLRDYLPEYDQWNIRFDMPVQNGMEYVSRTHPLVEGLADYIVNTALDRVALDPLAKRCGVIRTNAVAKRTTLILLRYRFHLIRQRGKETIPLLAEDVQVVGFEGAPEKPVWLSPEKVQIILDAHPSGNILPEMAKKRIQEVLDHYSDLRNDLDEFVRLRAEQLRDAHLRVRTALNNSQKIDVQPELPPDLMGIYVCLPE